MIKLFIPAKERGRFANIFTFLARNNSRIYITPEAIEFSNNSGVGKIVKDAFVDYEVNGSKRIELPTELKKWIKNWKTVELKNGQRDLIEICV